MVSSAFSLAFAVIIFFLTSNLFYVQGKYLKTDDSQSGSNTTRIYRDNETNITIEIDQLSTTSLEITIFKEETNPRIEQIPRTTTEMIPPSTEIISTIIPQINVAQTTPIPSTDLPTYPSTIIPEIKTQKSPNNNNFEPPTTNQQINTEQTTPISLTDIPTTTTIKPRKPPSNNFDCPDLDDGDSYTQAAFLERLTLPCRYDRLTRPGGDDRGTSYRHHIPPPLNVYVQLDIRHIEAAEHLQFKMHMLLQYRYKDARLDYSKSSPGRARIVGEDLLRARIWVPHVLLENERDSSIMGHDARDIYLAVEPNGEVTYSRRIKATLYCWMDLQKFPFDEQECDIRFLSWTYNASELILKWENKDPVVIANQLHLTEYSLKGFWTEENLKQGSLQTRGAFTGNYSYLTFRFHMAREMGYYMLDYFIPSIMLVCISWVSFWLQADASAPRITIGTSTMLSFITLATAQTRTLPKVSYIKASEIWFLGCTIFIFGSMVEFAFVNIIWRRKANVELKKVNSKYILKSTLTPRLHRKELMKGTGALHKSHSCSSLDHNSTNSSKMPQYNNYLTVHSFSGGMSLPRITTESVDDLIVSDKCNSDTVSISVPGSNNGCNNETTKPCDHQPQQQQQQHHQQQQQPHTWTTMTPQEISQWIDRRSRLVFPCAFVVFNAFYWGFVYWL